MIDFWDVFWPSLAAVLFADTPLILYAVILARKNRELIEAGTTITKVFPPLTEHQKTVMRWSAEKYLANEEALYAKYGPGGSLAQR